MPAIDATVDRRRWQTFDQVTGPAEILPIPQTGLDPIIEGLQHLPFVVFQRKGVGGTLDMGERGLTTRQSPVATTLVDPLESIMDDRFEVSVKPRPIPQPTRARLRCRGKQHATLDVKLRGRGLNDRTLANQEGLFASIADRRDQ